MNKQNKISLKNGYALTIDENDIVSIKVETEDDILEFDGKKGNLMDASDMESWFDDEDIEMSYEEMLHYSVEFLTDWGVDKEVAEAIRDDLKDWFKRYAAKSGYFKTVEPIYTGGNIYIFAGQMTNGNYFIADSSFFDVRILDADPSEVTWENAMFKEYAMDSVEWQEEHLVDDANPTEAVVFFRHMLKWVKENEPEGNYSLCDMTALEDELDTLKGDWR